MWISSLIFHIPVPYLRLFHSYFPLLSIQHPLQRLLLARCGTIWGGSRSGALGTKREWKGELVRRLWATENTTKLSGRTYIICSFWWSVIRCICNGRSPANTSHLWFLAFAVTAASTLTSQYCIKHCLLVLIYIHIATLIRWPCEVLTGSRIIPWLCIRKLLFVLT